MRKPKHRWAKEPKPLRNAALYLELGSEPPFPIQRPVGGLMERLRKSGKDSVTIITMKDAASEETEEGK